jgi:type I restriction enzyme S subunit
MRFEESESERYSLKQVEFKFPPLAEQNRIAGVLSALDAKIALNHRINTELEGMAKLLYDYWFVQYDFPLSAAQAAALGKPRLAGQPYRTSGGPMVFDPHLKREIPAIWKVGSLGDIADNVRDGIDPKDADQEAPYVGLEHIERQSFSLWRWGISSDVDSQKSEFKKGDFLFGKLRPYFHKVCQTPFDGICSTDILVIRAKGEKYQDLVGCQIFESDFVEYTTKHSSGTQMPRANWSAMADYKITIPDDQTLEAFNQLIKPLASKCNNSVLQNQELTTLRDWLLPMLMNGQVRVTE